MHVSIANIITESGRSTMKEGIGALQWKTCIQVESEGFFSV